MLGLPVLPAMGSDCTIGIWISDPGFGGLHDAGQPYDPSTPETPQGYDIIKLWMTGVTTYAEVGDFHVMTSEGNSMPIKSFSKGGSIVTLELYEVIPVQAWTAVIHCSKTSACMGYLPGDVDSNGISDADDIVAQRACLDDWGECNGRWSNDIDRDGDIDEDDMDRLIDLFDDEVYDPDWDGEEIPACDCDSIWDAPTVEAVGSRYLAITPADPEGLFDMSFVVTCSTGGSAMYTPEPSGDLNISILSGNSANADFLTPTEWLDTFDTFDALYVTGIDLAPETTFDVEVDYGPSWLSTAGTGTTWVYGDVDDSGYVDYIDISCTVDCSQGSFGEPGCDTTEYSCDVAGETTFCLPDGETEDTDIYDVVDAFLNYPYSCNDPCD